MTREPRIFIFRDEYPLEIGMVTSALRLSLGLGLCRDTIRGVILGIYRIPYTA
jgi:hypothetical protein